MSDGPSGSIHPPAPAGTPESTVTMSITTTSQMQMAYQLSAGPSHRAIAVWCGASTFAVMANTTKRQRLKGPSEG